MHADSHGSERRSIVVTTNLLTGWCSAEHVAKIVRVAAEHGAHEVMTLEASSDKTANETAVPLPPVSTGAIRITPVRNGAYVAEGWVVIFAEEDEPGCFPGSIAISYARHLGRSVICAGTSQVARITEHTIADGQERSLTAIEIGGARPQTRRSSLGVVLIESQPGQVSASLIVV